MSTHRTAGAFEDFCTWFTEHQRETSSVEMRTKFLEKAIEELMNVTSMLLEDIHQLEGRPPESLGRRLWTPNGITMRGDARRFG